MKVREVIKVIEKDGWYLVREPKGTLNSVLKQAGLKEREKDA